MIYHRVLTRITGRLRLLQQELLTLPDWFSVWFVVLNIELFVDHVCLLVPFLCLLFNVWLLFPLWFLKLFYYFFKYTLADHDTLIVLATELHISTLSK